jgi:virulence-associated protein VapD
MTKLYEISAEYRLALTELTDLEDDAVVDTLDGLKGELEVKAKNIIQWTKEMQGSVVMMKEYEKNMAARRKALENKIKRIQDYVKSVMESSDILKIESPEIAISIVNNPPKVDVEMEEIIPEEYWIEERVLKLDKTKLKNDLKNNPDISGAKLITSTRLKIK